MELRELIESTGCEVISEDENKIVVSCPIDIKALDAITREDMNYTLGKIKNLKKEMTLILNKKEEEKNAVERRA